LNINRLDYFDLRLPSALCLLPHRLVSEFWFRHRLNISGFTAMQFLIGGIGTSFVSGVGQEASAWTAGDWWVCAARTTRVLLAPGELFLRVMGW
jgi:hypothetical protein